MHNIGDRKDAQLIYEWVRFSKRTYGLPDVIEDEEAPEGWEFLGNGSFRSVWRSPEGVAYKVSHHEYDPQSAAEVVNLGEAWEMEAPEGCRLPLFHPYLIDDGELVIAVELIIGTTLYDAAYRSETLPRESREQYYARMHVCEALYRLRDMHDENVMVDENGLLVVVDFGN